MLLPLGKILHICDDVVTDPVSHKPSLLNLWEVVRLPRFPHTLGKLCVVALMRDFQGPVWFRADLLLLRDYAIEFVRRTGEFEVAFTDRRQSRLVVIRFKDVVFDDSGEYLVELHCKSGSEETFHFIDDRSISVVADEEDPGHEY
jgi:hypothetical protein